MHLVRYQADRRPPHVGVLLGDTVTPVAGVDSIAELLGLTEARMRAVVDAALADEESLPAASVRLLPPLDGRGEVWCAGVTYERSRGARMEETTERSIYDRVYTADRPELFMKSPAWRLVTDGEPIGIRADSGHDVPEPELAVVANRHGEIVGYTVCDDVSSRSIEGENPLYLPQAKVFAGGCALASGIRPAWEVDDPTNLDIRMTVRRGAGTAYEGSTSTRTLARSLPDLVAVLGAANDFPDGVVLATGTGIVPDYDFALQHGDLVEIDIEDIGTLVNQVVLGKDAFGWLCDDALSRQTFSQAPDHGQEQSPGHPAATRLEEAR
jgi:2-dehydro-3-deoxy-D-arabinonate dehydratase